MSDRASESVAQSWTVGRFVHLDLTVPDAPRLRDFYADVVGWTPEPLGEDWMMLAPDGTPASGVCHARGENADPPPQWLAYIAVDDLGTSLRRPHGAARWWPGRRARALAPTP